MFERRKFFSEKFQALQASFQEMGDDIVRRLAEKISATDPRCYWCGVVVVGKTLEGGPLTTSAGVWLDQNSDAVSVTVPLVVPFMGGAFVFVQGPCQILDVYVGNLSQLGGYADAGMPLCFIHDALPLGTTLVVRIRRLAYPARRGY